MSDSQKKDRDTIMARAVMLPITNFHPETPRLDGRSERLRAMISNMESDDREVRNRMFNNTFSPDALRANEKRPEISSQTTPELLAALDSLRRCKEYNARAADSRNFLVDALKKFDNRDGASDGSTAPSRRASVSVAPQGFMAPMAPMATAKPMEGVERTGVAPTAPMMNTSAPASTSVPHRPMTSSSTIDASRDPRRR